MPASKILQFILLPFGLIFKLCEIANEGARDIHNKIRFRDAIIDRKCCINRSSTIEKNCHILENTLILNSTIKRFSYVGRNSVIQNTCIGSYCSISRDVFIGLGTHPTNYFSTSPLFYRGVNTFRLNLVENDMDFDEYQPIVIENDVWIGARAIVLDGVKISDGAIIAANSVVTKDVPPYAIVGGAPAKIISYRFPKERISELQASQWWTWPVSDVIKRIKRV